jgi:hypothetical protein
VSADKKTFWDLSETVLWTCTRDDRRVAAISDMSEHEKLGLALSAMRVERDIRSPPGGSGSNFGADWGPAAPQGGGMSSQVLEVVFRKVQSGRVKMTAIACNGSSDRQIELPLAELNDLVFRLTPDDPVAPVGLWSRSRKILVWRAPQFLRVDVVRAWPAQNTKTAAVRLAILRHLQEIMIPEAPLTKAEARRRCLAEVPGTYPQAFERAWAELEPSRKRARGKHGPRR